MRMPRVTVGRIMVVVAVIAVACQLEVWRRRIPYCQQQAARCSSFRKAHLWLAESHEKLSARYRKDPAGINQSVIFMLASWSERGKAKRVAERGEAFRRAARYPWYAVPPEWVDPIGTGPVPGSKPAKGD